MRAAVQFHHLQFSYLYHNIVIQIGVQFYFLKMETPYYFFLFPRT